MINQLGCCQNPWRTTLTPQILKTPSLKKSPFCSKPVLCFHPQNPNAMNRATGPRTQLKNPTLVTSSAQVFHRRSEERSWPLSEMLVLCGLGYLVQGFRCFPWLALNFHMTHNLNLHPSILQLVQNSGNLPMAAKPLYGILSDAFYINGARRIPYISIGVILQVLSWGSLALIPVAGQSLLTLMAFVLLSNFGASITEVSKDALVAEYGQKHNFNGLQSYALMASAAGGILGNLLGGIFLMKAPPRTMFFLFTVLLSLQLGFSLRTREESFGLARLPDNELMRKSISESLRIQFSELRMAISDESIYRPLTWIVASIVMVPSLSGSIFCYQTQCLHLDPSVIGMSRVVGQLMLLSTTVLYNRYWRRVPMRNLLSAVQILYAGSVLLDLILMKQINLKLGIPNEIFALCFAGLPETIAQFKLLPFTVLFASLCPRGCEGSLTSFLASALCLSSIVSGCSGIGLALLLGITSGDYSRLPLGILVQFIAALVPLLWTHHLPMSQGAAEKEKKRGMSKRTRRNRRVGRVVLGSFYVYRRERESEMQM
ncbi:Folate-biopterin transporter [Parasponia andersonii]|uniref:Folate-biopterin transporter n=1 Tax=Parasponia andersonii TaxID=3476 RepID=A0A2P5AH03_PARAD|nr:Folate-biopterin transporter [Parasponia andersonii]